MMVQKAVEQKNVPSLKLDDNRVRLWERVLGVLHDNDGNARATPAFKVASLFCAIE